MRSLVLAEDRDLTLADLVNTQPLGSLLARIDGEWFTQLLEEGRLTCVFQSDRRRGRPSDVFAHECLLRGQATGKLISPVELYDVARQADLLSNLHCAGPPHGHPEGRGAPPRRRRHPAVHQFQPDVPSTTSLIASGSTVAAINGTAFNPERIVFEVVESDQIENLGHLSLIVEFYRRSGFKVALDDLGSGYGSLNLLGTLKPDFVKLDMQSIRGVDRDPFKAGIVRKLLEDGRRTSASRPWPRASRPKGNGARGFANMAPIMSRATCSPARPILPPADGPGLARRAGILPGQSPSITRMDSRLLGPRSDGDLAPPDDCVPSMTRPTPAVEQVNQIHRSSQLMTV